MNLRNAIYAMLAGLMALSCAEERPPIDRVQPNALDKAMFSGEWYYQRTVVDVPAANGFTFVGNTDHSGMSRVTWDLQEDYLYARRTTELIKGADDKTTSERYAGEVIAAFRVEKHFDIVNAYNPTTGEKLNILEENTTDRPWHQRQYFRVDWSQNLVHNYQLDFESVSVESVPYYVQEIDPVTGERHPDAPFFEEDGSYFDITSRIFAKAGTIHFPGYGEIPLCWLRGEEFTECGAGEYAIRHSFAKIDPSRQYVPQAYKGKSTEVFGFFETNRMVYDEKKGILEQDRERYISRHNLWKTWFDDAGNVLPAAQRQLRPIVYYVNRDFPEDLKPIAHKVADQWNTVFTDAVTADGYTLKAGEQPFVLCPNNPVQAGDPEVCGEAGLSPRIGDIRYSFMAYVPKYMTYGLLGLGPSNNDPETGEIISGVGYVYHHNNLAAYRVQEMLELLNGDRDSGDFIDGVDLGEWLDRMNGDKPELKRTHGIEDAAHMVQHLADGPRARAWASRRQAPTEADVEYQREHGFRKWAEPYLQEMYDIGMLNGEKHSPTGRLANLKDTYIEDLLLDDEVLMAAGHEPGTPVLPQHKERASIARGGFGEFLKQRDRIREEFAAKRNMYLPEMADDALIGLARELKGEDPEKAYDIVREAIYTAVLAHEVGHSLGLMHNFGGSDDSLNYHSHYWELRDDGNVGPRLTDPLTEQEQNGKIYNYAYSSVMDYAGRYTIDGLGVGRYDRAAILFGYANKVEVYKDNKGVPHEELRDWFEFDGDVLQFLSASPRAVHYTSFFHRMGHDLHREENRMLVDTSALSDDWSQATVGEETMSRVPYIYCSHTRANISDSCLTRDFGADSQERMKNILDDLNTWYITRNFTRGAIGTDQFGYVGRWYGRIYDRMKKWQDLYSLYAALLPRFWSPQVITQFMTDPEQWGGKTWAVQNAYNYLVQTLLMPDIGVYGGPFTQADGNDLMTKAQLGSNLGVDQARYYSTSWQGERECGYFWWECLHHVGFYLDKIMAIEALSDTQTNFVARSTPEDLRQWEISYYSTFPESVSKISAAMMSGDWSQVGPYIGASGDLEFPNYAGNMDAPNGKPVDPFATFSVQLYWQVLGQARFFDNYDWSFVDEARVFVLGTGGAPELDPSQMVTFNDPITGLTYGALRIDGRRGSGQAVLDRANHMRSWSNYCDDDGSTTSPDDDCDPADGLSQGDRDFVSGEFLDHIDLVKVMADLGPMMTYGNPYSL